MKPELYEEVELVRSVPNADLDVGDRAILIDYLIDYLAHPSEREMVAVLELSQSMERKQYVVTVPVGAIRRSLATPIAAVDSVADPVVGSREARVNIPIWPSIRQQILNGFGKLFAVLGFGKKDI